MKPSALERQVLAIISQRRADGRIIAAQAAQARVDRRQRCDTGFRTFFAVDRIGRHLDKALWKEAEMPRLRATHPALARGADFVLVLADGFISSLGASTDGEPWPRDERDFRFEKPEKTR